MPKKSRRRSFTRSHFSRQPNKLFLIVPEGVLTEKMYFLAVKSIFEKKSGKRLCLRCVAKGNDSSPENLLKKMKKEIHDRNFSENDEAWIVLDRDYWEKKTHQ